MRLHIQLVLSDTVAMSGDTLGMQGDTFTMLGDTFTMQGDTFTMQGNTLAMQGDTFAMLGDTLAMSHHVRLNTCHYVGVSLAPGYEAIAKSSENTDTERNIF